MIFGEYDLMVATHFSSAGGNVQNQRYPIGKFEKSEALSAGDRARLIDSFEKMPEELAAAVAGLTEAELDMPYRPDGWTVRQVVHHLADSHMNAYVRFRLGVTEDKPLVKTYEEKSWAELPDARSLPIEVSLNLVRGIHRRLGALMRSLDEADYQRAIRHPELGELKLSDLLALYEWHGRHHTAHVAGLSERLKKE